MRDDRLWQRFELAAGVTAMFTSRGGGVSAPPYDTLNLSGAVGDLPEAVARNRDILRAACGDTHPVTWMRQVHGAAVSHAGAAPARPVAPAAPDGPAGPDAPAGPVADEADALFTEVPGLPLGVLAADCAPVLIADGQARIVGAAHAGREGLAAGVVPALLAAMAAAGAVPSRMHAAIGPMICGACYEVPGQLRDRVDAAVPGAGCVTRSGTPWNRHQSRRRGAAREGRRAERHRRSPVHCRAPGAVFVPARRQDRAARGSDLAGVMMWL